MRYYKVVKDEIVQYIGTGLGGIEITQDEYETLYESIQNIDLSQYIDSTD